MPPDNSGVACADATRALDVGTFPQAHHLGPNKSRCRGPLQYANHHDDMEQTRTPDVGNNDHEDQIRYHEEVVGDAHEHAVDPPAEVAGHDANTAADDHGD